MSKPKRSRKPARKPARKLVRKPAFFFKLFLTGATARSQRALANIQRFCEKELAGDYNLKVIDLYREPQMASQENILAAPTLVKIRPLPLRRLIGDMSDEQKIRLSLGLQGYGT